MDVHSGLVASTVLLSMLCNLPAPADDDLFDQVQHHYATNNVTKIHYVTYGDGEPIVMIHGFPDFWYTWRNQMPALGEQFKVIAVDQRGYNLSDQPSGVEHYKMELLVSDIVAVLRHNQIDQAIICGHHWGGMVAWSFAMDNPHLAKRLIILNLPHPRWLMRELAKNGQQAENSAYARHFQIPDAHKQLSADALAGCVKDDRARARYVDAFNRSNFEAMLNYYKANYPRPPYKNTTNPWSKFSAQHW